MRGCELIALVAFGSLLHAACATPCVDDGLAQKACPEDEGANDTGGSGGTGQDGSGTGSGGGDDGAGDDGGSGSTGGGGQTDSGDGDTGDDGDLTPFDPGVLIIPMDTDYQDMGMLEAYGLVYQLLRNDVSIDWAIAAGKDYGGVDFSTSAVDVRTLDPVPDHGYRGGPFVISDADAAFPIVEVWQADNPDTTVHVATEAFEAHVARRLVTAPTIAVFADGNEDIARDYLMAAKIPDSTGDPAWPDASPDMLDPIEVAGPSDTDHTDGALFNDTGEPVYCQFMSMHWGVADAEANPEVVAEVRAFLRFSTHFFAQCQAVNAFENLVPHGHFLTPNGFEIVERPTEYDFYRMDSPFGQMDGPFESVGGSEPAYSVPEGDAYYQSHTVIITAAGTPEGDRDVWMTGFLDGKCIPSAPICADAGKISYLGGHQYDVALPISGHATTQGTRLFLNSLFEAPCALTRKAASVGDVGP
jgi:hypothetical protein